MKINLLALVIFAFQISFANAQISDSTATTKTPKDSLQIKKTQPESMKLYFSPLPVIGSNPAFGFIYGLAASGSMYLGAPANTKMSNALVTATYSTKNQLMFTLKSNVYTSNNKWFLLGDWRLFFSSQPTFGLGTGPQSEILYTEEGFELGDYKNGVEEGELMEFNLIRFHETFMREIKPSFYVGVGYHLDVYSEINDQLLDLDSNSLKLTNHFSYSQLHGFNPEKYTMSGVSANVIYDSRDNVANPYEGQFAFISFKSIPEFLGSDQDATSLWLEYKTYIGLSQKTPRHLIALWSYYSSVTSGNVPYMGLPSLGWDQMGRSGRAYPQGRFRGDDLFYAEAEYRVPLPIFGKNKDLLGAVVFANMTSASAEDLDVDIFKYIKPGAGVGLRVMIQKQSRANLTIDYAVGEDGGAFYLNLNETF